MFHENFFMKFLNPNPSNISIKIHAVILVKSTFQQGFHYQKKTEKNRKNERNQKKQKIFIFQLKFVQILPNLKKIRLRWA